MTLPHCTRCGQPRTPDQMWRRICNTCRRHTCTRHRPGDVTCYTHGCRCDRCSQANYKLNAYRRTHPGRVRLDATGTLRRIQALMALGWTARDIADHAGYSSHQSIHNLIGEAVRRDWVSPATAARIAAVYDELSMTPGPSVITRTRAHAKGWPVPLAWDDGHGPHGIDNRRATPIGTIRERAA